jgi:hypothetical protein
MRPEPHSLKVQKYWEEINRFEGELEQRHRQMQREEMGEYLEAKDRQASTELLQRGGYESKGLVKRGIMTSSGEITVRVRCYRRKNGQRRFVDKLHIFIGFLILFPIVTVSVSAALALEMQASSFLFVQTILKPSLNFHPKSIRKALKRYTTPWVVPFTFFW